MISDKGLQLSIKNNFPSMVELNEIIIQYKPVDFEDAILAPIPKLERIVSVYGQEYASGIVSVTLIEISQLMAFAITPEMIKATADIFIERWPDLKPSEIKLFKNKILNASIGDKLFRLDVRVFCELMESFYEQRLDVIETLRERKETEYLREGNKELTTEQIQDNYKKLKAEALKKEQIKEYKKQVNFKSLDEICDECKVDKLDLYDKIRTEAETEFADGIEGMTFETYLAIKTNAVLIQARKNPDYLKELIKNETTN